MWNALQNCFKIPELRKRILITIGIIALCRLAQNIPCPGLDPTNLNKLFEQLTHMPLEHPSSSSELQWLL